MRFLNENFFLSLMERMILACFASMMALVVHKNGRPNMMGALTSSFTAKFCGF